MRRPVLRTLLLDDRAADAELVVEHLARSGLHLESRHVDSAPGFERALVEFRPNLILSDQGVPGFSGLAALARAKEVTPTTPFIVVSGAVLPETVVASLSAGADDVVSKDALHRLPSAIRDSLERREGLYSLSPRQVEVLQLIVKGNTTPEVAETLGISVKTVQTHRTALMRRLDLHDISALVRYAVKVRMVPLVGD